MIEYPKKEAPRPTRWVEHTQPKNRRGISAVRQRGERSSNDASHHPWRRVDRSLRSLVLRLELVLDVVADDAQALAKETLVDAAEQFQRNRIEPIRLRVVEAADDILEDPPLQPPLTEVVLDMRRVLFLSIREEQPVVGLAVPLLVLLEEQRPEAVLVVRHLVELSVLLQPQLLAQAEKYDPIQDTLRCPGDQIRVAGVAVTKDRLCEIDAPLREPRLERHVKRLRASGTGVVWVEALEGTVEDGLARQVAPEQIEVLDVLVVPKRNHPGDAGIVVGLGRVPTVPDRQFLEVAGIADAEPRRPPVASNLERNCLVLGDVYVEPLRIDVQHALALDEERVVRAPVSRPLAAEPPDLSTADRVLLPDLTRIGGVPSEHREELLDP